MNITKNVADKSATKTIQTNGSDAKIFAPKGSVILPEIVPEKRQDVLTDKPEGIKKGLPTIEDQLAKLEELNHLAEKRELVKEALKNVSAFYIAPNGNCNLTMQDSNSKKFSINHPFVIEEIITLVTFKLEAELDKLETMIDFKF